MSGTSSDASMRFPARPTGLFTVAVLTCCHVAAITSTQIMSILVEPIKASLQITDTEFSLLQGFAFAVLSALVGVPVAQIADRGNRRNLILAGVLGWSLATICCGMVTSYEELFLARVAVGIGEVCLFPAALSLIADSVPRARYASSMSLFGTGGPIGTALALFGGGWLVVNWSALQGQWGSTVVDESWRATFLLCGVLNASLVLPLLALREPSRGVCLLQQRGASVGFTEVISHVAANSKTFGGVAAVLIATSLATFGTMAWMPTFFVRVHHMSYAEAGRLLALGALIFAVGGAYSAGVVSDCLRSRGRPEAMLFVCTVSMVCVAVSTLAMALSASRELAEVALFAAFFFLVIPSTLGGAIVIQISPKPMRARVLALYLFLVQLIAFGLGPTCVALLTDRVFERESAVGNAIAVTCTGSALFAAAAFFSIRRTFVQKAEKEERGLS